MKVLFLLSILAAISACGVKGDPLPPGRPPEIGRGKPTYQRATSGFKLPEEVEDSEDLTNDGGAEDEESAE